MRGKKTLVNTITNLILQVVTIVCGFILPRLILERFGSQYNGLISSITQFLACAVLLRSGIGGATRAALYKPLAEKNQEEVNSIMKATDIFMKKIGGILLLLIVGFSAIYPFFVRNEFSWIFTSLLFFIIGISTFAESFFGITYLILLQADQKLWVASIFKMVSIILNVLIASVLILSGFSIHIVKLGSTVAFCLYPLLLNIYVKRKYNLNLNVEPNNNSISQRWDAFWHQVATFVTNNTDIIVLTTFTNMLEVSVYSVYNMIISSLKNIVFAFSNGLEAAFGNMIAKKEENKLKENLSVIEFIIYNIATIIYTCSILLILPFINVYTKGINDVNYMRPEFAYILLVAQFFYCIRIPYQMVIQAAGHYKQTKNGAILEAILNVIISVILVIKFGLVGVAIGTLISMLFRTLQLSMYMCKNIIKRSYFIFFKNCLISFIEAIIIIYIVNKFGLTMPNNYISWFFNAVIVSIIASVVVIISSFIFFKKEINIFFLKINNIFKHKKIEKKINKKISL